MNYRFDPFNSIPPSPQVPPESADNDDRRWIENGVPVRSRGPGQQEMTMAKRGAERSSSQVAIPARDSVLVGWSLIALGLTELACAAWALSAPINGSLTFVWVSLSADGVRACRIAAGGLGILFGTLLLRIAMLSDISTQRASVLGLRRTH